MFICNNCDRHFEKPLRIFENHGLSSPPYEKLLLCPYCKSGDFKEYKDRYCHCCGVKLQHGEEEYCSEACRNKGEALIKSERKHRKMQSESALNRLVREVERYNSENRTSYSYGQYVAAVLPHKKESKAKCMKKRKRI